MRKIYYAEYFFADHNQPLENIIESNFKNFSLEDFSILNRDESKFLYVADFEDAFKMVNISLEINSAIIIEYQLSEDDLLNLFLLGEIKSFPTNSWYYWKNAPDVQWKEIKKDLKVFS